MQEELSKVVVNRGQIIHIDSDALKMNTRYVPFTKKWTISWSQVKILHIYKIDTDSVKLDEKLLRGIYVSDNDSWALILTDEIEGFSLILSECGEKLKEMYIRGNVKEDLDVSTCKRLQKVEIVSTPFSQLHVVKGLEFLFDLRTLRLEHVKLDGVLDVSQMIDLTEITLLVYDDRANISVRGVQNTKKLTLLCLWNVFWNGKLDVSAMTELKDLALCSNLVGNHNRDSVTGFLNLIELVNLELICDLSESVLDLSGLKKLELLTLCDDKKMIGITGIEQLHNLSHLSLRGTGIRTVPEGIRGLRNLKTLDFSDLELDTLPEWLPELGLSFTTEELGDGIRLDNTKVRDVDMSIFDEPQEVILKWFEERNYGNARPLNEVKVVFLGDGEAGKTYTIARLLKDGEKPDSTGFDGKATPGIVIKNKDYELEGQKIQVHFWDFGGQEILHSMHRMFLTDRTLYVVIINARDDTQDDRARYWLHNIKSFAPGAPVLLVLNKIDQNPNASIDLPDLQRMYDGLKSVVRMSALEYDKDQFNKVFTDALMAQVKALGTHGVLWPSSWLKLKKGLETMQTHYIHGCDYEDLCEESGVEGERENLLHWFNDLGVSFCYTGSANLEDYVILKPEWLTNAIYIVLFNECKEAKNGIIPRSAIDRMLRKPRKGEEELRRVLADVFYNPQEVDYVMDVVRKFRLSYKVRNNAEFIPVLCQRESLPVAEEYAKDPNTLEFTMDYEYLPDNVIHRLMVEMRNDLDLSNVWRTGARFAQKGTSYSAVVKSEGNLLRIFVRSDNPIHRPNTYLHILKDNIDRINADMKLVTPFCEVIYKADGIREAFDYEDLLFALKDGEKTYRSKNRNRRVRNIPIEHILNQSGRTAEVELDELRNDIITACMQLQGNIKFWGATEDEWNTGVRDFLRAKGYLAFDQSFQGISGGGKKAGELDLDIRKYPDIPWTVYEALKIKDKSKTQWNTHLTKLLDNYNPSGLNYLFLVTYVACDKDTFSGIWNHFREHLRWFDPGDKKYERLPSSFSEIPLNEHGSPNYIRAAKITYDRAGNPTTVCHIFARMGR